jgi:class 3 adenylate cyclase
VLVLTSALSILQPVSLRARFCLFGDTVNTAARLEAAGAPGCVQLSRSCWRLAGLPDALSPLERRLQLKGKADALDACLLAADAPEAVQAEAALEAQLLLYDDDTGAQLDD